MRTIRFLLEKEFLQIFRNKSMIPIMFVMPIIQLLILSNAASFDLREIRYVLVDKDQSVLSRSLAERLQNNPYFVLADVPSDESRAEEYLRSNEATAVIHIPAGMEKSIRRGTNSAIQLLINAEEGNSAGLTLNYLSGLIRDFQTDLARQEGLDVTLAIHAEEAYWFNPLFTYPTFMVPGILVVLVSMIGLFLCGMNIVREREMGTIEQLNVTPIRKIHFIMGKLMPFWIIGMVEMGFGLAVGKLIFQLPIVGSLWTVFALSAVYLVLMLGIGLLISTVSTTQQQAMFGAWFIMVVCMLLGGLFTPIESMPDWAQHLTQMNPVAYMVDAMRRVLLKGAGVEDLGETFVFLTVASIVVLTFATLRYRKASA